MQVRREEELNSGLERRYRPAMCSCLHVLVELSPPCLPQGPWWLRLPGLAPPPLSLTHDPLASLLDSSMALGTHRVSPLLPEAPPSPGQVYLCPPRSPQPGPQDVPWSACRQLGFKRKCVREGARGAGGRREAETMLARL